MNAPSKEYLLLFNAVSDAEAVLEQLRQALLIAQQRAEELYMEEPAGEVTT